MDEGQVQKAIYVILERLSWIKDTIQSNDERLVNMLDRVSPTPAEPANGVVDKIPAGYITEFNKLLDDIFGAVTHTKDTITQLENYF